jgi:hypothetical protein
MRFTRPLFVTAGLALAAVSCTPAAATTTTPAPARTAPAQQGPANGAPQGGAQGGGAQDPQPKPYAQVIRGNVETREGLFKTHRIGEGKLYFEIPASEMGKEMLLVTRAAFNTRTDGLGGDELSEGVVRWERRGNRVLFRRVQYGIIADPNDPIAEAVARSNYDAILASFNVEAYGPDSAAVIDVSRFYTSPPNEMSIIRQTRGQVDAARSFL